MEEKIVEKIKKLLALSKSPNENEAMAATLKAQALMAKYEIDLSQVETNEDRKIVERIYCDNGKHEMKKWKYGLATIVANNFMCKMFLYGTNVVFYGYEEDAEIALNTFRYLYEAGNRLALKYYNNYRKNGMPTKGVMNTYLSGFKAGIKSILEKQSTALMVVTPQKVKDSFEEITKDAKIHTTKVNIASDTAAYSHGVKDGKNLVSHKMLTA